MKVINVLAGDTLEHAQIGDTLINGYGDQGTIIYEGRHTWWVRSDKFNTVTTVFKFKRDRHAILAIDTDKYHDPISV